MAPDEGTGLPDAPPDAPLEGDEGEPEIATRTDIGRAILETCVAHVTRSAPVALPTDTPVSRAIETMRKKKVGAVMVVSKTRPRRLVGILTERDVVARVLARRGYARLRLEKVMTPAPEALHPNDPLAYALNKMSAGHFRHVPLVDERGVPVGMLSTRDVVDFVVECIPEAVLNLPSDPELALHPAVDGG